MFYFIQNSNFQKTQVMATPVSHRLVTNQPSKYPPDPNYDDNQIETETVQNQSFIIQKPSKGFKQHTKKQQLSSGIPSEVDNNFQAPTLNREPKNLQKNSVNLNYSQLSIVEAYSQSDIGRSLSQQKLLRNQSDYPLQFQQPFENTDGVEAYLTQHQSLGGHSKSIDSEHLDELKTIQPKCERLASDVNPIGKKQKNATKEREELSLKTDSEQSRKERNLMYRRNKRIKMTNDLVKQKYKRIAAEQQDQILVKFGKQFPEIMAFNTLQQSNNQLAIFWSQILLLVFLYNYFTCLWFMVFPGFPSGFWGALEVATEIISFFDLFIVVIFPRFFPQAWQIMFLIHQENDSPWFTATQTFASLPTSIILSGALRKRPAQLKHFAVACTRLLKLFRYRKFSEYFDRQMLSKYAWYAWLISLTGIIMNFLYGMHFILCVFILPSRFEDGYGWFQLADYYKYGLSNVPRWQIYLDSAVYCVSNMGGMGFGNIVPMANGEWFASCVVLTMGASVYKGYYADFANYVYSKNKKSMQNQLELDQCNQYAQARHLPDELRKKINYFFKNLKIPFEEFKQRKQIVQDLPITLKEEVSVVVNLDLIKEMKFFQLCPHDLIMKLCTHLNNQICMINEHVFQKDAAADYFYFINEGVCEVVASDEQTLIRFMSKGTFFGEIGCLLTGKRSCSVIVRTTTILHKIRKDHLIAIFEAYPSQLKYLKAVGRQRLLSTDPHEIKKAEDRELNLIQDQIKQLEYSYTVFGQKKTEQNLVDNLPTLQSEFARNMQKKHGLQFVNMESSQISNSEKFQIFGLSRENTFIKRKIGQTTLISCKEEKANFWPNFLRSLWHTPEFKPNYFIVIPWSPLFLIWNFIQAVVVIYDSWMVFFQCFFQFEMRGRFLALEIICIILLALDMPMRACTAVTNHKKFCLDREKVLNHYLNTWLIVDLISCFPVCYFLMIPNNISPIWIALSRLPRALRIFRLNESFNMLKWNSNIRIEVYTIVQLFVLFGFCGHLIACGFVVIGKADYNTKKRFDGKTLFQHGESRNFVEGISDDFSALTPWGYYQQMIYLGFGILNCCVYGDLIPLTPHEQLWDLVAQIFARILWAYIGAECGSLIGSLYETKAEQISKRDQIVSWMKQNQVPNQLIERYKDYQQCTWENSQGIEEQEILKSLPHTLRTEIKQYMFKDIIQNWQALPNESHGSINTLIGMLKLDVYPKNEYITTAGEIGKEMYFIVKGIIEIRGVNHELLNTLSQGQNFGEMALLDESNPLRMANAVSQTMVSLAVLTKEDFDKICELLPTFRTQMIKMSQSRRVMNKKTYESLGIQVTPNIQDLQVIQEAVEEEISERAQTQIELKLSERPLENIISENAPEQIEFERSFTQIFPQKIAKKVHEEEKKAASCSQPKPNSEQGRDQIQVPIQIVQAQDMQNTVWRSEQDLMRDDIKILNIEDQPQNQLSPSKNYPRKTQMHRKSIAEHFKLLNVFQEQEAKFDNATLFMRVILLINMALVFYNMIFIPLQFAYRIEFKGVFLALEIITIVMYLTEIGLRIYTVLRINKLKDTQLAQIKNSSDRKLFANQHSLQQKIDKQISEIVITSVAVLPLSWFISLKGQYEPFGWLLILQTLRLVKTRPVTNFWEFTKKYELNLFTMIQGTFHYYYLAHYFACIMIGIAIFKEDHRKTWLRKVPSPQVNGNRLTPNVFDDMTPLLIYNNAQYYLVNTLSNLSIGDISAVNPEERFLNSFLCWFSTFILSLVYVCNFTVVKYLVTGSHIDYFTNYYDILSKIENGKVKESTINSVRGFFDFMWYSNRGVGFDQLRQNLPVSISADLGLAIYKEAIERSIIFYDITGEIDMPLVISVFKQMEFKQMLSSHFVVKVGEFNDDTIILLEGQLRVYGLADNQLLGVLTRGSHFGLDLSNDFSERDEILQYDERVRTQYKMDFASDNFDNRSIVNIASSSIVTVGVLKKKDRDMLYHAFPEFKQRMQFMNRVLFQLGKTSLEKHTLQNHFQNSKYYCKNLQLNNIMFATQDSYRTIIDQNLTSSNNEFNLSLFIKSALLRRPREAQHIVDETFKAKMLTNDLDLACNFDSLGNQVLKEKVNFGEVQRDSTLSKVNKLMQFLNCLYIAVMIPFEIAFDYPMNTGAIIGEAISLGLQVIFVIIKLRTQIIFKGRSTVRLEYVLKNYRNEGLIIDLFGLLPFNLIFGILYPQSSIKRMPMVLFISFLRVLRIVTVWRMSDLIDELTIYLKSASYYIIFIKAIVIWFIIGHLMTSSWYYFCSIVQRDYVKDTWPIQQELLNKKFWEKYLRSYYFMLNVATGVGSGDMVPQNEGERFFITLIMTAGDLLWQFGFGLLIFFWGLERKQNDKKDLEDKINVMHKLMEANEDSNFSKLRMEKYFAYLIYQQQNSWLVDKNELMEHLPVSVVQEIVVQTNEEIFKIIFKKIHSENLIRELCLNLESTFYLPQDFILKRGDIANEVFFIVDGTVYILARDQNTIIVTLNSGQYFGEIAVLSRTKRENDNHYQAATFCLLNSLSKEKIDQIAIVYPQLRQHLEETGRQKKQLIDQQQQIPNRDDRVNDQQAMAQLLNNSFVSDKAENGLADANEPNRGANFGQDNRNSLIDFENVIEKQSILGSAVVRYDSNLAAFQRYFSNEPFEHISEDNGKSYAGSQIPADFKSNDPNSRRRLSDYSHHPQ